MARKRSKYSQTEPVPEAMPETATGEPSAAEIAAVQHLMPIVMPEWYAAGVQLVWAGNDVQLIFTKPVVLGDVVHGVPRMSQGVAIIESVGMVRLSIATLKDISILLAEQVAKRESEVGVIETDFTRQRAQTQVASKKKH
jgi:hypothetical protein